MSRQNEINKTNPTGLSSRQLAALRLLIQGLGSARIALELGTTQRTVNRWKRSEVFQAELRRSHELLILRGAVPKQIVSSHARPRRKKMRDYNDDAEMEALISSVLGPAKNDSLAAQDRRH